MAYRVAFKVVNERVTVGKIPCPVKFRRYDHCAFFINVSPETLYCFNSGKAPVEFHGAGVGGIDDLLPCFVDVPEKHPAITVPAVKDITWRAACKRKQKRCNHCREQSELFFMNKSFSGKRILFFQGIPDKAGFTIHLDSGQSLPEVTCRREFRGDYKIAFFIDITPLPVFKNQCKTF